MKNEKVELGSISRFYLVEYERDNRETVCAVIEETWDENTDSITAEIASADIDGVEIEILLPKLSRKTVQKIKAEIFEVFERGQE